MLPEPTLVESYMQYMHVGTKAVLIGGRRYVNTDELSIQSVLDDIEPVLSLPTQRVDTGRGPEGDEAPSEVGDTNSMPTPITQRTPSMRSDGCAAETFASIVRCTMPSAGLMSPSQHGVQKTRNTGIGCTPLVPGSSRGKRCGLHQEPPGGSNETDRDSGRSITREQLIEKCPAMYRKSERDRIYEVPKVTVYIPAYNCIDFIEQAVQSALNQTFTDLEVVICNDGSTDGTGELLDELYGEHPRVVIIHQENGGFQTPQTRPYEPAGANTSCNSMQTMSSSPSPQNLWSGCLRKTRTTSGLFTEIPTSSMRVTRSRPRLFLVGVLAPTPFKRDDDSPPADVSKRDFNRTHGFDERIKNAVDFDFFLKLSELTTGYHLQMPMYLYRQHDENTSKVDKSKQDSNTHYCVRQHLSALGCLKSCYRKRPFCPRKIIMNLVEQPEEHRLDCSALFGKFGFERLLVLRHRWELDRWISQHLKSESEHARSIITFSSPRTTAPFAWPMPLRGD